MREKSIPNIDEIIPMIHEEWKAKEISHLLKDLRRLSKYRNQLAETKDEYSQQFIINEIVELKESIISTCVDYVSITLQNDTDETKDDNGYYIDALQAILHRVEREEF